MPVSQFPFRGNYEGSDFTVEEVISSLTAQRQLIRQAVRVLEEVDRDYDAQRIVIRVISITEGSLFWDLVVEIWGTYQHPITEKVAGSIEKALGVDIPEAYEPLVAIATMAVIYWGLRYAYERVAARKERDKSDHQPGVHIEGNYNTVIQILAGETSATAAQIEKAIDTALFPDRTKVAKASTDFVRPAKKRDSTINVNDAFDVDVDTLREVPSDAELTRIAEPFFIELTDTPLSIRGTDRDSQQAGWRGLVENDDRFPRRLPLVLSPGIDPEVLADHARVNAVMTVEGERFFDGTMQPRKIHLRSYHPLPG